MSIPSDIAGLQAWYKADALALSDGAAVSSWTDSSGNARPALQATGANQPLYKAGILNGLPVVRFDGVNDFLRATFTLPQPTTVFVVFKGTGSGSNPHFTDGGTANGMAIFLASGPAVQMYAGSFGPSVSLDPNLAFHYYSAIFNGASSELHLDGGGAANGSVGAGTPGGVTLGAVGDGTVPTAVDIAEFFIYNTALSAADRQTMEAYLAARYFPPPPPPPPTVTFPASLPTVPRTYGQWSFVLTDAAGTPLAELSTASGRSIALKRNSYTEVNLTLSHEDDAANLLLSALANSGVPKLRGYRRGVYDSSTTAATLRFRGYLAAIQENSEETSLITATFRSPFGVLIGDGDKSGRFLQSQFPTIYSATDAGAIAKALIDIANKDSLTGLATDPSLIAATILRDRTYPVAQNIGSAVLDLTTVQGGFDFYETYIDGYGGNDAFFNVVPSIGSAQPNARFEYGPATLSNVRSLTRSTLPPINCVFITGGNGLTSFYSDAASVAKYGKWWGQADFSTIIEQATLDGKAQALARPNPVKTITFVPDLALSPVPFDDWNLGDTIPLYASRGALSESTQLRVNGFTIPIDENGIETVTVDDPTSPEEDAVLQASLIAEVVA